MQYRTTAGWSLISSGITTLCLKILPGDSLLWGIGLLAIGAVVLLVKNNSSIDSQA